MRKQILSFKCALRGLSNTIKSESHMRFHMVAGFYVLLFSLFYDFTSAQIALLVVLIASVMVAEVFNTSIEEICNLTADHYEPLVKTAKDAAAGAVFLISVASVVVAVMFFWDIEKIFAVFEFFANNMILLGLLCLSFVFAVVFIVLGPIGIKEKVLHLKFKIKH